VMTKVSVVLPVYNEGRVLKGNVQTLIRKLSGVLDDFEIIISENGSTDNTVEIAKGLESDRVRILHEDKRLGKGAAIKAAAEYAHGSIIVFMDADLASDPENIRQLVEPLEKGAAIVIGSRYHPDSKTKRGMVRDFASRSFNWLVRVVLGSSLSDHQCGFKSFRKDSVLPLINEIQDQRWFWDTELLVRAQRKGLKIKEIPVTWIETTDSKFRLVQDSFQMFRALVRFKMRNG
jgi:glycosyltransferase AglD